MKNKEIKQTKAENKQKLDINIESCAIEVLSWLVANVESYIDNQTKTFDIELIIDKSAKAHFPETSKLVDLFIALESEEDRLVASSPDLKERLQKVAKSYSDKSIKGIIKDYPAHSNILKAKETLHSLVFDIFSILKSKNDAINSLREKLFTRMSYFYELKGIHKGNMIIENYEGKVIVTDFVYSGFEVEVTSKAKDKDGKEIDSKSYVIPARLSIKLEILLKPKSKAPALF